MSGDQKDKKKKSDATNKYNTETKSEVFVDESSPAAPDEPEKKNASGLAAPAPGTLKGGWKKFFILIKEIDGALLLVALVATILISFIVDRGNRIDDDVRGTHAVLDSALDAVLAQQSTGSMRHDDPQRNSLMSVLRYRAAAGQFRVDKAEKCVYIIIKQIDDFGTDTERVSYLQDGTPIETGERIIQRIKFLRKRITQWAFVKKWFLSWIKSGETLFERCFSPL